MNSHAYSSIIGKDCRNVIDYDDLWVSVSADFFRLSFEVSLYLLECSEIGGGNSEGTSSDGSNEVLGASGVGGVGHFTSGGSSCPSSWLEHSINVFSNFHAF